MTTLCRPKAFRLISIEALGRSVGCAESPHPSTSSGQAPANSDIRAPPLKRGLRLPAVRRRSPRFRGGADREVLGWPVGVSLWA